MGEHDEAVKHLDAAAQAENADTLYNAVCAADGMRLYHDYLQRTG